MTEIWLIRHGETAWNAESRLQGQLDVPLSPKGIAQAFRVAERLKNSQLAFDALYTSDLSRALQTARPIAENLGLDLWLEPRLREIDVGKLQNKLHEEIKREFPDYYRAVSADPWNTPRPGGESMADVACRVEDFLHELPEGRFIAVAHGGVIRAALKVVLGLEGLSWRRFHIQNTSITRLTYPEGSALTVGDVGHLETWADHLSDDQVASGGMGQASESSR